MDNTRAQALGGIGEAAMLPQVTQPPGTPAKAGNQPSTGMIVRPLGQSAQLEVLAWNTGAPRSDNKPSHAERQFIEWFHGQSLKWKENVTSVDVLVFGRNICPNCDADLKWLEDNNPHIKFSWIRGDKYHLKSMHIALVQRTLPEASETYHPPTMLTKLAMKLH